VPPRLRLVLLSFLLLFVELALIRWTGSNVLYLSYFSNFVLLGSFLGIGIGFLRGRARVELFPWAPVVLAGFVAFVLRFPVDVDRRGSDLIYFGELDRTGLPIWVILPLVFVLVAAAMAMIAEGVARTFVLFEPLEAYRLDIGGSVLGIVAFSLLAFLQLPPVAWGAVTCVLFLLLLPRRRQTLVSVLALALVAVLLFRESEPAFDEPALLSWSPYYKIHVEPGERSVAVDVNGVPHQTMFAVADVRARQPIYLEPYERLGDRPPGRVLIVGAGTGTDVAVALEQGATSVDAVEIDPRLQDLGEELHPDRPYDDPRVTVHVDDGRAFLERTDERYDLILFALPDSITLVSGQSALRLESYLFTLEAIRSARDHLADDGVFAMYNYYREQWLVDRLAGTVAEAFGRAPCVDAVGTTGKLSLLAAAKREGVLDCPRTWEAAGAVPPPARDDYPFLYLRTKSIPAIYLVTLALILAASALLVRIAGGPFGAMRPYVDLFFMGAAFLLLETKNVVQFALLFGTTWLVNALVFGGILVTVLAAVEVARRVRIHRPERLYWLLLAALVVAFVVPQRELLELPFAARLPVAVALAFAPVFLANLVFAERFRSVGASNVAFGANLLGAMVGGVLEYGALLVGYRYLLVVTAVLYLLAFVTGRRHLAVAAR
jgi:hypothetical protein